MKKIITPADVHVRRATMDDARRLFDWRNDEETRAQSRTTEPVQWEGHVKWLEHSLKKPPEVRLLCIAEKDGEPIGTVRADMRNDGCTEISYTIAPAARGRGLSKPMVLAFVQQFLAGRKIVADIKKGHVPSESVAHALGLTPVSESPSEDPSDPRPMVEWR